MDKMNKLVLVAGGDSFIWGTELRDQKGVYSKSTFTALLAKSKGMHYECVARPANANQAIARMVLNYCESHKDIEKFVTVSWTFTNRYEFRFPFTTQTYQDYWESISTWTVADLKEIEKEVGNGMPEVMKKFLSGRQADKINGVFDFSEAYMKYLGHSEYWEVYTSLLSIVMLQNYLDLNNIPYMFTLSDNCILNNFTIGSRDPSISSLYNQLDMSNWYIFPEGKGFYQWARENKYPVGETHPLEEAHADAAQLMKDKFYELVTKFNKQN